MSEKGKTKLSDIYSSKTLEEREGRLASSGILSALKLKHSSSIKDTSLCLATMTYPECR